MDNKKKSKPEEPVTAKKILQTQDEQEKAKQYNQYVTEKTPKPDLLKDMWHAFLVGGAICTVGQLIMNIFMDQGMDQELAASFETLTLVLISVLLTGFNIYPKITKYGGAGSLVPITGFANSVAAPAIEFQKEGQVFGIGCKIFTIAGPVILFGIFASWVLGIIYWIGTLMGVV